MTITYCDRCENRTGLEVVTISCAGTVDLCYDCRDSLAKFLKPLPKAATR